VQYCFPSDYEPRVLTFIEYLWVPHLRIHISSKLRNEKKIIFGWTKENESSAIDVRSHLQQLLFGDKLTIYLFPYFLPSSFFFFSFILFPLTSWAVWQLMDKTEGLADFFFLINCHNLIYKWANREIFSARKKLKTLNYYIDLHRAYFETLTVYSHCVTLASS